MHRTIPPNSGYKFCRLKYETLNEQKYYFNTLCVKNLHFLKAVISWGNEGESMQTL